LGKFQHVSSLEFIKATITEGRACERKCRHRAIFRWPF
jgi:hypothetical protein